MVAEVSGQLGKSLLKFCSGDLGPEGLWPDTQLLDPLLKEASTAPLAQSPSKGMDGEFQGGASFPYQCPLCALILPARHLVPSNLISCRSTLLHLHIRDHGATQGRHCRAQ